MAKPSVPRTPIDVPAEIASAIKVPATTSTDAVAARAALDLEKQRLDAASTDQLLEVIKDLQHDRASRQKYASYIFWLVAIWLASVFVILLLEGFGKHLWLGFALSDTILLAAIGSTTVSVIGMMIIVLNHFFHRGKSPSARETKKPTPK